MPRRVFITGGTGYVGSALIERLLARGHHVRALARPGAERRLPPACEIIVGNALVAETFAASVVPADTFVQLVGVPHPSPAKARQFREIDLVAAKAGVDAARHAGVRHFVYVSVAHPAPVMKAYQAVRIEAEAYLRASGLDATVIRPWYVLGPGHRWPLALRPVYALLAWWPSTRASAQRLGLVTLLEMVAALVAALERPATGVRVIEVPEIRDARS